MADIEKGREPRVVLDKAFIKRRVGIRKESES